MAGFVQIIEFKTSRIKEIEELGRPSRTEGSAPPTFRRIVATADRDHPGTYFHHRRLRVLRLGHGEFRPAGNVRVRCQDGGTVRGPVIFHNLDVMWEDTGDGADNG